MYANQERELEAGVSFQKENKPIVLESVTPTNALYYCLFKPMPCEIKAAKMRNEAVKNMKENNIAGVAFNYLDNKKYEKSILFELVSYGISSFLLLFFDRCKIEEGPLILLKLIFLVLPIANTASVHLLQRMRVLEAKPIELLPPVFLIATLFALSKEKYMTTFMLFFMLCHILPNVGNLKRHVETKNACNEWLAATFTQESSLKALRSLTHFVDGYSVKAMDKLQSILEREDVNPSPIWDAISSV